MSAPDRPLVIVGASHAGTQLAVRLRESGYAEPITLISDEPHFPYQRPPLSKTLMTGKATADSLALRGPDYFKQHDVDLRLGARVTSVNTETRQIRLGDGPWIGYDKLVLATGARARTLSAPGVDLDGVHSLRTLNDATRLSAALEHASRVCVVGGGFIGLELASAIAQRGLSVTVLESQPRLLARSLPPLMSDYLMQLHRAHGVDIRLDCQVQAIQGAMGAVQAVALSEGDPLPCDLVIQGVGVIPNTELAAQAGVACENGILVDGCGRTDKPDIYAIGDVANMALPAFPGGPSRARLESVQAANDGARALASLLIGSPQPFTGIPWFWSDQYDIKLQMAGLAMTGDDIVVRGDMQTRRFSVFYLRDHRIAACHSVNRPADHIQSRKLIQAGQRVDRALLANPDIELKQL